MNIGARAGADVPQFHVHHVCNEDCSVNPVASATTDSAIVPAVRGRRPNRGLLMAQRVEVVLIDDVDGGEAAETVAFALDGANYEIDLSEDNAAKLRDELAPWIAHARRVRAGGTRPSRPAGPGASSHAIRAWAQSQGLPVSRRGRVPVEVRSAYEEAHR
jgi:hypothetical protein